MKDLNSLKQVSDELLSELKADDSLKHKILQKVAETDTPSPKKWMKFVPAACCTLALAVGLAVLIPTYFSGKDPVSSIQTFAAGNEDLNANTNIIASGTGLHNENVTVVSSNAQPQGSIFVGTSADAPTVRVNGMYYRLVNEPSRAKDNLKGSLLGNAETADSGLTASAATVVSNCLAESTPVYAAKGSQNAWVLAEYNGSLRVFQRVSYEGNGRMKNESLSDIAPLKSKWISLSIQGVGTVSDPELLDRLSSLLAQNAMFESNSSITSGKVMVITTVDGLSYEFTYKGSKLSSCGTWSCPEFFDMVNP